MTSDRPLSTWRFDGELRTSQQAVLDAMDSPTVGHRMHIVAPPGSGKTLLGLLLAVRRGHRALVLTPTATIREQWMAAAKGLVPVRASGPAGRASIDAVSTVSDDPAALGDLTALTYQMLSVVDTSEPFAVLARAQWVSELVDAGRVESDAEVWLEQLSRSNAKAYRAGLRRRGLRLRKAAAQQDAAELEAALHTNARALIARLVEHRVETIVLDECHHLLDHWALVIHCLISRLREAGIEPVLIGLTATLPSTEDQEEYENYTGLLSEVDFEIPTPAVVKEGNLAPYRDFAWFVGPSKEELAFLKQHESRLAALLDETLATHEGVEFLEGLLLGEPGELSLEERLGRAFASDHVIAEAAVRMLTQLQPDAAALRLVGPEARTAPTLEQRLRLIARFALERVLPNSERSEEWQQIKRTLSDFGYLLTDRGVPRGRDPIDTLLASSISKDYAIGEILRLERSRESSSEVRAVVVLDFAQHGHGKGKKSQLGLPRAGALRCFSTVVADRTLADMRPVLVTSKHLRIARQDAEVVLPRLADLLALASPDALRAEAVSEDTDVLEVNATGVGSARVVRAVSSLIAEGTIRLVIGTRGLLGEGWDCPAVNTLIDLSSVATSSATQQLRGRTLRLDPAWPTKVAHNWTVACVLDPGSSLEAGPEISRLARKHERIWGLSRDASVAIVRGLAHTLEPAQLRSLALLQAKERGESAAKLNAVTAEHLPARPDSRRDWGIGDPYLSQVTEAMVIERPEPGVSPFRTSLTIEALVAFFAVVFCVLFAQIIQVLRSGGMTPISFISIVLLLAVGIWQLWKPLRDAWRAISYAALPRGAYEGATLAIAETLRSKGDVPQYGRANIHVVTMLGERDAARSYQVELTGGTNAEQRLVLESVAELFGAVASPRFLLEVGTTRLRWGSVISWLAARVAALFGARSRFLPVPKTIGRRRADAEYLAGQWRRHVGPCVLHEVSSPEQLALLAKARRRSAAPSQHPSRREVWS